MNEPLVSIIVPAFNASGHLARSLGSVARLDYPRDRMQVIVVDDGSSDGTADRARELLGGLGCETRVLTTPNGGPARARNAGLAAAGGDCIQFLDSDDEVGRGKLIGQARALADPACALAYSRWTMRTPEGVDVPRDPDLGRDPMLDLLRPESFVPLGAALFRADWLRRVGGFDPALWFIEDVELELRLARAGATFARVALAEPAYRYVQRGDSLSRSNGLEFYRGCVRNARLAESHWRAAGESITPERAAVLVEIYENGLDVFAGSDPAAFEETFADVVRLAPGFRPAHRQLRALSHLVGVRNAYRLRSAFRHGRRAVAA